MRSTLTGCLILVLLASSGAVMAEEHGSGVNHAAMPGMKAAGTSKAQMHMGHGQVNKVDTQNGKVNLTHGPIESLGWPGMTMDFSVKDPAILKKIKPGQKVEFEVVNEGPVNFYVKRFIPSK